MSLAQMLIDARTRDGKSKAASAREIGISRMTYDMWERGAWGTKPTNENIWALVRFTGHSRNEVVTVVARRSGLIHKDERIEIRSAAV